MDFVTPVVMHWLEREIVQLVHHEGSIQRLLTYILLQMYVLFHLPYGRTDLRCTCIIKICILKIIVHYRVNKRQLFNQFTLHALVS